MTLSEKSRKERSERSLATDQTVFSLCDFYLSLSIFKNVAIDIVPWNYYWDIITLRFWYCYIPIIQLWFCSSDGQILWNKRQKLKRKRGSSYPFLVLKSFHAGEKQLSLWSAECCCAPPPEQTPSSHVWILPLWVSFWPELDDQALVSPEQPPGKKKNTSQQCHCLFLQQKR